MSRHGTLSRFAVGAEAVFVQNDLNMDTGELNEKNYDKTDLIGI